MTRSFIFLIAKFSRYLIILVLLVSGLLKLTSIGEFQRSLYKLAMIYDSFVPIISYLIPLTEIILAIMLFIKSIRLTASKALLILFSFFTVVLVIKLLEGTEASCGCFGPLLDNSIGITTIIRNIILMGLCFLIYLEAELVNPANDNQLGEKLKKNSFSFLVITVLLFLSVMNFTFAIQNQELKNRIYMLIANETLIPGETIASINVIDEKGQPSTINFANKNGYLIYIMQYGCKPCSLNQDSWKFLYNLSGKKKNVIAFSISNPSLTALIKQEYEIDYPLFSAAGEEFKMTFKVFSTPLTILLSPDGTVEKVFKGTLKESDITYLSKI